MKRIEITKLPNTIIILGLTRLWQRVTGIVILLKELKDRSSFVKGIISLFSSNSRLPCEYANLKQYAK